MLGIPRCKSVIAYNGYTAGLGNRIRVVLGSLSLAEMENRSLYYVWPTGDAFGPRLTDLWHFDDARVVSRATSRILAKRWHYVDENVPGWLGAAKRSEYIWQIRTGSELVLPDGAPPWTDYFRKLVPVESISRRVRAEHELLAGRPYVGVMVRSHTVSHQKTLVTSPVEWFLERMEQMRSDQPDVQFFLSCDTPAVQERIMGQIDRCFALTDKGEYNSIAGVRSAVCDLYLMAGAGHLVGPHFSSFVELAKHLAGDSIQLETPASPPVVQPDPASTGNVRDPLRPWERDDGRANL